MPQSEEASSPISVENDLREENDMPSGSLPETPTVEVTASMVDEEEALQRTTALDEKAAREKALEEYRLVEEKQRLKRLHHLLNKSNLYAKFLLDRMEKQLAEERERQQRAVRKSQANGTSAASTDEKSNPPSSNGTTEERGGDSAPECPGRPRRRSARRTRTLSPSKKATSSPASTPKGSVTTSPSSSPPSSPAQIVSDNSSQASPSQRPTRTRKRPAYLTHDYMLANYLDRGSLAKRAKVAETDDASSAAKARDKQTLPEVGRATDDNTTDGPAEGDVSEESVAQQPMLVTGGKLRQYQLEGLQWLKVLFENGVNGILADEMGLGKTLQCIALVAHLIEQGVPGPYLIAAPLSTLPNWVHEFKKFAPKIPIVLYHGSQLEREQLRRRMKLTQVTSTISTIPVVITSYEIVMRDRKHLGRRLWKYVIVDEGHRIKNLNCRLIKELKAFQSANRLLLTGTPLQNNLAELWSLLNFLLPDIFDDINSFQAWFDFSDLSDKGGHERIVAKEEEQHVLDMLHKILTPFLLRRVKTDVELSIPPKKETIVYAKLTSSQQAFYKALLALSLQRSTTPKRRKSVAAEEDDMKVTDMAGIDLEAMIRKGRQECPTLATSAVNLSLCNVHMQLRKCCNHPYLLSYPLDSLGQFRVDEEIISSSGKMQLLDCLLAYMRKDKRKVLIFSQMTKMLDIIEDYASFRHYPYCRLDGSTSLADRQDQIQEFNGNDDAFLFLLSTRAGGLGINLTAADIVIIYDSDWNPQADLQAQDRCHRIGQTRPVSVLRLVAAHSIDEQMVERAAAKRKLEKMVIHKGKFKGNQADEAVTPQSLLQLLSSSDHDGAVSSGANNDLTDEDITLLLSHAPSHNQGKVAGFFKVIPEQETFA